MEWCFADEDASGNRFTFPSQRLDLGKHVFRNVQEIELNQTLLSWDALVVIAEQCAALTTLSASLNAFKSISSSINTEVLTCLKLDNNMFTSLSDLAPLTAMSSLQGLHLRGNKIRATTNARNETSPVFGSALHYIDLSENAVTSWSFVDSLTDCFPGMTALRFSKNPIYAKSDMSQRDSKTVDEEAFMLTLARIPKLQSLNFSTITVAERTNAELFYLSRIAKELSSTSKGSEGAILAQHKCYSRLCDMYGAPDIIRTSQHVINPNFLEARLIAFNFHLPGGMDGSENDSQVLSREIPKSFDVYKVKSMVASMFKLHPRKIRLIWETGEWDPVAGYEDVVSDFSDNEAETQGIDTSDQRMAVSVESKQGRFVKREQVIEDSTRQIGFCVDGQEATVRVERLEQ